jgi:hypothetical protein
MEVFHLAGLAHDWLTASQASPCAIHALILSLSRHINRFL